MRKMVFSVIGGLALLLHGGVAHATSCQSSMSALQPMGGVVIQGYTDARGAATVQVLGPGETLLQSFYLMFDPNRLADDEDWPAFATFVGVASFPVNPEAFYKIVFVDSQEKPVCAEWVKMTPAVSVIRMLTDGRLGEIPGGASYRIPSRDPSQRGSERR